MVFDSLQRSLVVGNDVPREELQLPAQLALIEEDSHRVIAARRVEKARAEPCGCGSGEGVEGVLCVLTRGANPSRGEIMTAIENIRWQSEGNGIVAGQD